MRNRNGIITGYIINVTTLDTGEISQYVTLGRNLTLDSLAPFSTYAFIIAARTSIGAGPFSTDLTIQTLEDGKSVSKKISDYTIVVVTCTFTTGNFQERNYFTPHLRVFHSAKVSFSPNVLKVFSLDRSKVVTALQFSFVCSSHQSSV